VPTTSSCEQVGLGPKAELMGPSVLLNSIVRFRCCCYSNSSLNAPTKRVTPTAGDLQHLKKLNLFFFI
jgi:hypothetical protein